MSTEEEELKKMGECQFFAQGSGLRAQIKKLTEPEGLALDSSMERNNFVAELENRIFQIQDKIQVSSIRTVKYISQKRPKKSPPTLRQAQCQADHFRS